MGSFGRPGASPESESCVARPEPGLKSRECNVWWGRSGVHRLEDATARSGEERVPAPGRKREGAACSQLGAGAGGCALWAAFGVRGVRRGWGGKEVAHRGEPGPLCVGRAYALDRRDPGWWGVEVREWGWRVWDRLSSLHPGEVTEGWLSRPRGQGASGVWGRPSPDGCFVVQGCLGRRV